MYPQGSAPYHRSGPARPRGLGLRAHQNGRKARRLVLALFRRLSPFPFAALPVVASDPAFDHFVSPFVACDDERGEKAATKAKRAKGEHDDELQELTHCVAQGGPYSLRSFAPHPC
jgi:hypothetical protein